ncbi:MAG: haloacid dehalogenase [Actinomycetota bacterium]|jgi:2-haloacid dehalogenase
MTAVPERPRAVAFDVVETLFSLEPVRQRLQGLGLPAGALEHWFASFLRDAMALSASAVFTPFRAVAAANLAVFLSRHGVEPSEERVDGVLSGFAELDAHDDVRRWKLFPEPYLHTAAELGLRPAELAMVAVHAWDVHGAKQAGLMTGWADRLEGRWNAAMTPPDVTGSGLVEVVAGLVD